MGVAAGNWTEEFRNARLAVSTHLDAVLKVDGAKALRLAHLLQHLSHDGDEAVEMVVDAGSAPRLWLDANHFVSMEPDAKTYRLSFMREQGFDVLLETDNLEAAKQACNNVLAHAKLQRARRLALPVRPDSIATLWPISVLVYVWLTGVITGMAALALWSIYLK